MFDHLALLESRFQQLPRAVSTCTCSELCFLLMNILCLYPWQKSHNLTLPAWSTNGTTWAAMRNLSYFNMMWLFKSPERAKLTGGLFSLVLCSKNVEIIFPLRAVGQNALGAAVGSFQPEHVDRWLFNSHEKPLSLLPQKTKLLNHFLDCV